MAANNATYTGEAGTIEFGSAVSQTTVASVRSFTIDQETATIEDTVMGLSSRTYKPSLSQFSGSADVYFRDDGTGQTDLFNAIGSDTLSIINLYPIEFIHICFFKIFTEMFSYNDDTTIYNFNYIFINFHKLQVHRYNNNLENLQKIMTIKMETYMNSNMQGDDVDDIMNHLNQFSISS
jgi:hypothetical protein